MQKYFIASDLHLEFHIGSEEAYWRTFPEHREAKVCICAGDLTVFGLPDKTVWQHFNGLCNQFDKVIYVPGNHEYYGCDPASVTKRLDAVEKELASALKVLRAGDTYTLNGQRFIGDSLWFSDRPEVHIYKRMVNDTAQIKNLFPWAFTQSNLFLTNLKNNIQEDDIVVSHHIPTDIDTSNLWKKSPTQAFFVNRDTDSYVMNPNSKMPKAWVYGHTHDRHDYFVRKTRFICNPIGYPSEDKDWKSRQLVFEI